MAKFCLLLLTLNPDLLNANLEFDRSGFIENLDEGDPELVYFKRLRDNAT
ncbi:hypothetical protein C1752_12051 [Acaryochloris thomasi RCC1774]|uniref:Uncharacterized protein n=1 Tax=Acaryochloris thomasi RCC1774 TaxID=1764569 RepID=A0A2W1J7V9_9CYAN|nr:hypothetical protein [Acaryochloris thomasi]PZD70480.1 hypothetical protein C1752_12051 [Acaryochloris thomasi RCC1774]